MHEDFRKAVVAFSERAMKIRQHLKNEEATKVSLLQPFIGLLAYDHTDPTEVTAEHGADFSEKYKNRVDYAILKNMQPVIAIECKSVGNARKDDRGQLKAYYNASKTVKLGVLTDGILYEFFVDSSEPNMMDDEPFLTVDFAAIAAGRLTDTTVDGLNGLRKFSFDPNTVAENARMNIIYRAFYGYLNNQFSQPSVEFTRFLLRSNDIKHVRDSALSSYQDILKRAFQDVFNARVLHKLNIPATAVEKASAERSVESRPDATGPAPSGDGASVDISPEKLADFDDIKRRIASLCHDDKSLSEKINLLSCREYTGKFVVFIEKERKGRLLEIHRAKDSGFKYLLADGLPDAQVASLDGLEPRLFDLFRKQAAAL